MAKLISYQRRRTIYCQTIIISVVVLCYCDFNVCYGSGFQQLLTPSQPARSQFTLNDVKLTHSAQLTQSANVQLNPTASTGGFLPGIGTYYQPYTVNPPRDVRSPVVQEQIQNQQSLGIPLNPSFPEGQTSFPTTSNANALNLNNINSVEQIVAADRIDPGLLPEQNQLHAAASGEGKCTFVQMKGTPLPNMNCQKGGMACDKQCGIVDNTSEEGGTGRTCVTVMERMCSEVPKQDCRNVTGKVCNNIADEICEPVQVLEPLTR